MAKGQKQAVVEEVMKAIPTFSIGVDNAINMLSTDQLETIKTNIYNDILNGYIEYGKDVNNIPEVRTYARSMVMNHLKKAKELNGGNAYKPVATGATGDLSAKGTSAPQVRVVKTKVKLVPNGVDLSLTPENLHDFVKSLV